MNRHLIAVHLASFYKKYLKLVVFTYQTFVVSDNFATFISQSQYNPTIMNNSGSLTKKSKNTFLLLIALLIASMGLLLPTKGFCQKPAGWELEKMPADLEHDYALTALPPDLRKGASGYLLDPAKGYYMVKKGTNGFVTFVARTEWEWSEFRQDVIAPMSYDAEGARVIFPVYRDVAAMRSSGKYTALQIRNIVIDRIRKGIYKAPKAGISYMLAPIMRWYVGGPDKFSVLTMNMPHMMPYEPYLSEEDVSAIPGGHSGSPYVGNATPSVLGAKNNPFTYLIIPLGEVETAKIVRENKELLGRLVAYKSYFKI